MIYDHILVRYGELSLKGKNRSRFENQLRESVKKKLKNFSSLKIKKGFDRMYIELNGQTYQPVIEKLQEIFGIHAMSVAIKTDHELESIQASALAALKETNPHASTFKITGKRSLKSYPINSQELNHIVGGYILKNTDQIKVDVHHPDVNIRVEVKDDGTYISCLDFPGAGGLPLGVSGKTMLMLSGGIDSPVAAYLTMKRGVRVEMVHFHSPPFTSERAKQKVEDLTQQLTKYGEKIRLHIVPFTKVQQEIKDRIPENYSMTIMRRFMLRITEQLAQKHGALAIATGENLGQVASQTLHSMNTINEVTTLPMIRPLITMDKLEIMALSKKIGTYDISIRPYEDCCTIFLPSAPKTKPNRDKANRFEQNIAIDELVKEAVENTQLIEFSPDNQMENEFKELF